MRAARLRAMFFFNLRDELASTAASGLSLDEGKWKAWDEYFAAEKILIFFKDLYNLIFYLTL